MKNKISKLKNGLRKFLFLLQLIVVLSPFHSKAQHYEMSFKTIDEYARNVPYYLENDPQTLVSYLVKPAKNEWQKIRAIFIWITDNISYDVYSYNANNVTYEKCKAMNVFLTQKGVCSGYANLFMFLCGFAEIDCSVVEGYAKGFGYYPGMVFDQANHAWNAIEINNKIHLFDVTWAAGYYTSGVFVKRFNDFWWDTPSSKFITSHFAIVDYYNFLNSTMNKSMFEQLTPITSSEWHIPKSVFNYNYLNQPEGITIGVGISRMFCLSGLIKNQGTNYFQLNGMYGKTRGQRGREQNFWGLFSTIDLTDGYPCSLEGGTVLSHFLRLSAGMRFQPVKVENGYDFTLSPTATIGMQLHLWILYSELAINGYINNGNLNGRFIASVGICL